MIYDTFCDFVTLLCIRIHRIRSLISHLITIVEYDLTRPHHLFFNELLKCQIEQEEDVKFMRDKKEIAESRRVFVGQMFTSSTIGPHLLSQNIVHVSTRRRHPANSALAAQRLQLVGWKCVVHVRPICVIEHVAGLKNKSSIKEKVSRASRSSRTFSWNEFSPLP